MLPELQFPRRVALLATLTFAVASLAPPALAAAANTITFQPGNPWTQEIGTVSHYESSHDYSVAVAAGNTFQINLVTRDPNVFFKVEDETHDKELVDTYKTGATTWSTKTTAAANYTIHVYVDPAAMPRNEKAKYALQVGQYGARDMQPATTEVTFKPGNPWAQATGTVNAEGPSHDYTVAMTAGNTLQVNLFAHNPNLNVSVADASGAKLFDTASSDASTWTAPFTTATTVTIHVYADPASMLPGQGIGYALQIGQYPTNRTAPAAAGSAGTPAAAGTAAAAAPASAGSTGH